VCLEMEKECEVKAKYADNPLAQRILAEGLAIQHRFSAEPVYARTGKGYLKSVGVSEIAEAKKKFTESEKNKNAGT